MVRLGIQPEPGGRVSLRTEPALDADVLAVLGLHIDPPVYLFAVAVTDRSQPRTAADDARAFERSGLEDQLDDVLASVRAATDPQGALAGLLAATRNHVTCEELSWTALVSLSRRSSGPQQAA